MRTFLFREIVSLSGSWPRDAGIPGTSSFVQRKCLVVDDGGKSRTGFAPGNFLFFVGTKRRNYMELKPVKSLQVLPAVDFDPESRRARQPGRSLLVSRDNFCHFC